MSHGKYEGLADRVKKHRLNKIHESPFLARSQKQIHGGQYTFDFAGQDRALDVFHRFDPDSREIEWFFYSEDGEFLLQFGFCLKNHRYAVYAAHPGLWLENQGIQPYFQAIQDSLAGHYPPLQLVKRTNGEVEITPQL